MHTHVRTHIYTRKYLIGYLLEGTNTNSYLIRFALVVKLVLKSNQVS